jgi:heavy metal translocating P-type ATPase
MKFRIENEIPGRIRLHVMQDKMTFEQADRLHYYFNKLPMIKSVKVRERTGSVILSYFGKREPVIEAIKAFSYEKSDVPQIYLENSGRKLNSEYWTKLVNKSVLRAGSLMFLPAPVSAGITIFKSFKYIWQGIKTLFKGNLEVAVLDATAIAVSIIRKDYKTAGSVMFLLAIGEILEEWTHKKSVDDLARSLSLNVDKVWVLQEGQEVLCDAASVKTDERVVVHMGSMIPFDGVVEEGEALVNQASLTGESEPVRKTNGGFVYAGTVLEEGELTVIVKETGGSGKFDRIVKNIQENEKLKSSLESKAEHIADSLVPWTFGGTALTYLLTRNVTKALSILMVDFSCALKLAMPISVLSAIREASAYNVTVKGGKYLEAVAEADTIVFDKTGTLTKAQPTVVDVISFNGVHPDELLRIAACLEEHFPHSMAKAVTEAASAKNLEHEEMHTKVEYVVAHGISTTIAGEKAVIGSHHFVFEDENCQIPEGKEELFASIPPEYSQLYLAVNGKLAGVICIMDPVREEAHAIVNSLRKSGIKKVVMMTGDNERTARVIAKEVGVDEYYAGVLPEDKADFVQKEKAKGRKVIMVGDGINDAPALSAADVGIAISDGAQIAREIADITIGADDLYQIVTLRAVSVLLMKRIRKNYRQIVGINSGLIGLGAFGILQPATTALLHNASTLAIGLRSMGNLIS